MRNELADVVDAFLQKRIGLEKIPQDQLPILPAAIRAKVIALARFGARLRGAVSRDAYRHDIIISRPSAEVATRLGKQLAKLCQALAVLHQRTAVTIEDYQLIKKVMLDTVPQRIEDVVRQMLAVCTTTDDTITIGNLSQKTHYPQATVGRILQDLTVLQIVQRNVSKGGGPVGTGSAWTLTNYIRDLITRSGLYRTEDEVRQHAQRARFVIKKKLTA